MGMSSPRIGRRGREARAGCSSVCRHELPDCARRPPRLPQPPARADTGIGGGRPETATAGRYWGLVGLRAQADPEGRTRGWAGTGAGPGDAGLGRYRDGAEGCGAGLGRAGTGGCARAVREDGWGELLGAQALRPIVGLGWSWGAGDTGDAGPVPGGMRWLRGGRGRTSSGGDPGLLEPSCGWAGTGGCLHGAPAELCSHPLTPTVLPQVIFGPMFSGKR